MCALRPKKKTYSFCLNENPAEFKKDDNYMGKLESNFLGTEFLLYDSGKKPKKIGNGELRSNLCAITYVIKKNLYD